MKEIINNCINIYADLYKTLLSNKSERIVIDSTQDIIFLINLVMIDNHLRKKGVNLEYYFNQNGKIEIRDLNEILRNVNIRGNKEQGNESEFVVPITKIEKNEDASKIFSTYFFQFEGLKKIYSSNIIDDFLVSFIEIVQNIPYHSMGSPGFVTVMLIKNIKATSLVLTATDFGVGIPKSLIHLKSQYFHYWNDSFAVSLALKERVSRFKDNGRGKGLAGVYNCIKRNKGILWIRSGRGFFVHKAEDYEAVELDQHFPGVQCFIKMDI